MNATHVSCSGDSKRSTTYMTKFLLSFTNTMTAAIHQSPNKEAITKPDISEGIQYDQDYTVILCDHNKKTIII